MEEIFKLCANVGFPVVVSLYLLARIEQKLDSMIRLVLDLINLIDHEHIDLFLRNEGGEDRGSKCKIKKS